MVVSVAPPRVVSAEPVLSIDDLRVHFFTRRGVVKAVDGVSFTLRKGERFGLVGESGSGKSTTVLGVMRMVQEPGRIAGGSITLHAGGESVDLATLPPEEMRRRRLSDISLIPQGSMNSLNPVRRIADHFRDSLQAHDRSMRDAAIDARMAELLKMVGLKPSVGRLYPHELSGGMKQRVCIALSLCLSPRVIIADEPTSALDVVVQRRVMQTLATVQERVGASVILVGHDMGLLAQFVDRLGVMYAGKLVEVGPIRQIFANPLHPYTRLLIESLPTLEQRGVFRGVPGLPPSLLSPPEGCLFAPRCPSRMGICAQQVPPLIEVEPDHWAACHLHPAPLRTEGVA
jgi:peptide/nickel transport system ATP-binding protein